MKVNAVLFDLDGTLTQPYLDFDQIRAEIGITQGPILEAMAQMPHDQQLRANNILIKHELEAANNSCLNPGVHHMLADIRQKNRSIGLVTRNSHDSVDKICQIHDLQFDTVITREDGPVKPDPFAVLKACEMMQVVPQQSIMVGDFLFDLISARRAGAKSVLYSSQPNYADYQHEADFTIDHLGELNGIIETIENHNYI